MDSEEHIVKTQKEVANFLGVSEAKVRLWKQEGAPELQHAPYDLAKVRQWLEAGKADDAEALSAALNTIKNHGGEITVKQLGAILPNLSIGFYLSCLGVFTAFGGLVYSFAGRTSGDTQKPSTNIVAAAEPLDEIRVRKQVVYYRIVRFSDRHSEESGFEEIEVGHGPATRRIRVFDEGFAIFSYLLHPHTYRGNLELQVSSSGVAVAKPIYPTKHVIDINEYERSSLHKLDADFPLYDDESEKFLDHAIVGMQFFNGYQFNQERGQYESDGGVHIRYPVDQLQMVFDFGTLDSARLLKGEPQLKLRRAEADSIQTIPSTWENNVVTSGVIENLKPGDSVHCDWVWSTE